MNNYNSIYDTGYPNGSAYHNMGFVASPYPGKEGVGDYGPTQKNYSAMTGIYDSPVNPTYPYPLWNNGVLVYGSRGDPLWVYNLNGGSRRKFCGL
jgi:hypothetical protein